MKIVSWNCNGKFREKYKDISKFDADIYVIQECENPTKYPHSEYYKFANNYLWLGTSDDRGLGVFAKRDIKIDLLDWESYCLKLFLPIRVNDAFDLIAVWTKRPYIEEYYIYQSIHMAKFNEKTIIMGDFNSNSMWDYQHGDRSHSAVVKELETLRLISAYHYTKNEEQGKETVPTFFMHKNPIKKYHIDYCFINSKKIKSFYVDSGNWLKLSDHVPIVLDTF